jgi:hypothetical protein
MPDWLMTGLIAAAASWGAVRLELRYMRRDINAAHKRMDRAGLPGAWIDL